MNDLVDPLIVQNAIDEQKKFYDNVESQVKIYKELEFSKYARKPIINLITNMDKVENQKMVKLKDQLIESVLNKFKSAINSMIDKGL